MSRKLLMAVPLCLLLFGVMPHIEGTGDRSCFAVIAYAQSFDRPVCYDNCRFKYNIKTERDETPILPFDTVRRRGYEKCIQKCDQKFWGWDDNS